MALATISSKKRGAKAGGGDKRKHFGKCGKCWNCRDKGHKRDACPKPKSDEKGLSDGKKDSGQQGSNSNKGEGTSGSNSNVSASSSKKPNASMAVDDIDGAWVALVTPIDDLYEFLTDIDEDKDMPDLESTMVDSGETSPTVIRIANRGCREEAEKAQQFDDNHRPSADGLTIDMSGRLWGHEVEAYVAKMGGKSEVAWDLYDSRASHHMSPCQEDFINFQEIPAKLLTAANRQTFSATGVGNMIVSIPNGDGDARIKLTCVLYTPTLGFTLISIGRIDDAGYYSTFGGRVCEIQLSVRQTVGTIPKSGGVYRVPHGTHVAAAAIGIKRMTLHELHKRMGHISPRVIKDLLR